MTLAWSDEFDTLPPGSLPDETKWDYEYGFVRNEELQFFIPEPKIIMRVTPMRVN